LTGSDHDAALLWDTATGKVIGPPLQHQDRVVPVALSADGKTALTGSDDKTARLWKPPTSKTNPPRLDRQAKVITVTDGDDHSNGRALNTAEWQKRKRRLNELGGSPILD